MAAQVFTAKGSVPLSLRKETRKNYLCYRPRVEDFSGTRRVREKLSLCECVCVKKDSL